MTLPTTAHLLLAMSMPEISLIFFMGMFVVLVVALVLSRSRRWERIARIPLEERPIDEQAQAGTGADADGHEGAGRRKSAGSTEGGSRDVR